MSPSPLKNSNLYAQYTDSKSWALAPGPPGEPIIYLSANFIPDSYSTDKFVQEKCLCFDDTIFKVATKMSQSPPKNDIFVHNTQTGECLPYIYQGI